MQNIARPKYDEVLDAIRPWLLVIIHLFSELYFQRSLNEYSGRRYQHPKLLVELFRTLIRVSGAEGFYTLMNVLREMKEHSDFGGDSVVLKALMIVFC